MSWKTQEYKRQRDRNRLWNLAHTMIYLSALGAVCWGILWGINTIAAANPPGPLCGNGQVDPGENCTTCPRDVQCLECEICIGPICQDIGGCDDCGNGVIDEGEDCTTCPADVQCPGCLVCVEGACVSQGPCSCGDGTIDPGENCENCKLDVPCDDGTFCKDAKCVPKCNPGVFPMEVIFLFDTSGSMSDDIAALCSALDGIQAELEAFGLDVTIDVWGIAPGITIPCVTGFADQYFPLHNESWAPAVTVVSTLHPWKTDTRILVPISDEGPYQGNPCETPEDHQSIDDAIVAANKFGVFVSPIMGQPWQPNTEECIQSLGRQLAIGTGGTWHFSGGVDMQDIVLDLIQSTLCACTGDLNGDGVVGINDLLVLLSGWATGDNGGDVDGDGDTDHIDLLLLLQGWGTC